VWSGFVFAIVLSCLLNHIPQATDTKGEVVRKKKKKEKKKQANKQKKKTKKGKKKKKKGIINSGQQSERENK